jgi:hypothetical protein
MMDHNKTMERLGVIAVGCFAVPLLVGSAAFGLFPWQPAGKVNAISERLDNIQSQLDVGHERLQLLGAIPRTLATLDRKVSNLETRVIYPRYARHFDGCPQCRGDVPSEEGGPPPLCEEGFELWKAGMRAEKERRSPATEKPEGVSQ